MSHGRKLSPQLQKIRRFAASNVDAFIQDPRIMKVKDKDGLVLPFRYTYSQQVMARALAEEREKNKPVRLYVLKSRQVGSSTFYLARFFVKTWAIDNAEAVIVAQQEVRAQELLERCKFFYQSLPDALKLELAHDSKFGHLFADTRGKMTIVSAKNIEAVRGGTKQFVQLSEFPLYRNCMGVLREFEQFVHRSGFTEMIIEGTGKGRGSDAHEFWKRCKDGRASYRALFLAWQDDPACTWRFNSDRERDLMLGEAFEYEPRLKERMKFFDLSAGNIYYCYQVLREQCHGDWEFFLGDYPCDDEEAWRATGASYFGSHNLNAIKTTDFPFELRRFGVNNDLSQEFQSFEELEQVPRIDENGREPFIKIWKRPHPNCQYVIGADSAQGLEDGNFSSAFVMDMNSMEMMAEFHGKLRPDEFAYVLASLGNIYNTALLAPEYNPPGNVTVNELARRIYYPNLYIYRHLDDVKFRPTRFLGWQTNSATRPIMLALAKRIVEDVAKGKVLNLGVIKSRALVDEMSTFIVDETDGKAEAAAGSQDDRVVAWSITITVASQETYGSSRDIMSIYKTNPVDPVAQAVDLGTTRINPMDAIAKLQTSIYKERQLPDDYQEPFQWPNAQPPP